MPIIEATTSDFNEKIKEGLTIVDFYATWCGPCKMLSPIIADYANESGTNVIKVDVDKEPALAQKYGIMSIPTLYLFKDGEVKDAKSGFMAKEQLSDWVNANK